MLVRNHLNQYKADLKIERNNLKTEVIKTASKSKSKSRDASNTKSTETTEDNKLIRSKMGKTFETLTICLTLICMGILSEIYVRLRPEPSSESVSTTNQPMPTTNQSMPTTNQSMPAPSTDGEYYSSIVRMKKLARLEQSLVAEMNDVIKEFNVGKIGSSSSGNLWHKELLDIKTYIQDYDSSVRPMLTEETTAEQAVVSHPLLSYRMLRRVSLNLPDILTYNMKGRLKNVAKVAALIQPAVTDDDIIGAMEGILRLQATFLISPHDFAHGRVQNIETKSGLTATDCFLIGNMALYTRKQPSTAIEWIVQALRMFLSKEVDDSSEMMSIQIVREELQNAIEMHNNEVVKYNPWTFITAVQRNLSEMTKENENELMAALPPQRSTPHCQLFDKGDYYNGINFDALCRGDKLRNETLTKNLKCYYKTSNPFLAIKPLKVEIHSYDPLILQFYDILPNFMINHFINTTSNSLQRALVYSTTAEAKVPSKQRIACNNWIDNEKSDEIMSRLPQIIHEATSLNLVPQNASQASQVSTYGAIGGFYGPHYDVIHNSGYYDFKTISDEEISIGDRIATIMFYLSDLKLGGGTAFPKIGVLAKPIKGSAVFWYNLKKNGQRHDHALHGGCPVLLGEKWVLNKWILSGDQMFIRKCSLDPNL